MALIEAVNAREILDSRGNPTVEVEVLLDDGIVQRAAVPSGASTGAFEAYELRDGDKSRYGGKGVLKAVAAVIDELGPAIEGVDASEQRIIDEILIETDGTENKARTGANAILGVSLAVAKAAADSADLPLFRYLGGPNAHVLPVPLFNVINGGEHADNGIDMQEFFLAPDRRVETFAEALRWGTETYHVLKGELKAAGYATGLGDEGGFAPDLPSNREGLDFLVKAIEKAGFTPGTDIALGLDVAATEFFTDGVYRFDDKDWTAAELTDYYVDLVDDYPIVTIEDALAEDDWDNWKHLTDKLGSKIAARRRRPVRHEPAASRRRHQARRRQLAARQGQPDRHAHRDARRGRAWRTAPATRRCSRTAPARPRTPRSPTSPSRRTRVRSRAARPPAASASRNTISFCASRKSWATRRSSPVAPRSRASRA